MPCLCNIPTMTQQSYILAYVNDLLVTGNNITKITQLKKKLTSYFTIKDLGILKCFLELEFVRTKHGMYIGQ